VHRPANSKAVLVPKNAQSNNILHNNYDNLTIFDINLIDSQGTLSSFYVIIYGAGVEHRAVHTAKGEGYEQEKF
jgi:hypothetical protein